MYYYFFFSKFLRSTFNLEKKAFATYKQPALFTVALFFKVYIYIYISQKYVHNLERNWKNSVCISVKNFSNL